jgi:LmbE family N-acetylglucosaminyl deacetylase
MKSDYSPATHACQSSSAGRISYCRTENHKQLGAIQPIKRSRLATRLLTYRSSEVPSKELGGSTLVFSPHPDDECLGCGGTILKKKQAGAKLKIVHMTDGSRSHPATLISKHELTAIRRREAMHAGAVLGADDVHFLDFEDQTLTASIEPAIERVREMLFREAPEHVFVPYGREPLRQAVDHIATTNIVLAALSSYPRTVTVWEYPVWFWFHWPWVGFKKGCLRRRFLAENSVRLLLGSLAFFELRKFVNISDVLDKKIAALAEHRSQMTELIPNPDWTTLGKISGGEWLQMFYLDYEFFRCTTHQGHA